MTHKIQIYKGKKGWYICIVACNGKIVADGGEPYASKSNCIRAAKRLRTAVALANIEVL